VRTSNLKTDGGRGGGKTVRIGIIIYANDSETVWNAFRFGNFALNEGDEVQVFLLGKGVECESLDTDKFKVMDQMKTLVDNGGTIFACGSCLKIRQSEGSEMCPLSTMRDLYDIVRGSDKIVTF
jgi:sulfur relay (sulfurtransferase) complex TusBCD TusD component (DsrE family)